MKTIKANKKCGHIRTWLYQAISSRIGFDADWLQHHIANCPRCHRRIVSAGRVNLALSAMKSQPHKLDLLMRANTQAIGVLKHSLRRAPKACKLKAMLPEPKLLTRWGKYAHPAANAVACLAILFLMKIGVFSSMNKFQRQGQKVVKQYYAGHVGQEMADEIFTA
ncbi:MAG: hypothetical protein ACYS6W_12900 [Planctomycetota bacterium]|jgi:hypothetical protein